MKSIKRKIPSAPAKSDLKIIYEDDQNKIHQFLVQKNEFLKKLRYFQDRKKEINETGGIYIHDSINYNHFQAFISALEREEVEINNDNYEDLYNLSQKYQYIELLDIIKEFVEQRPDICETIDNLSQKESQIDLLKEEQISKNLDFCLKHGNLQKLPLSMLARILNSPKRVLNDHSLLFSFVTMILEESSKQKVSQEEEENLGILVGSLDYLQMSNEELEKLFSIQNDHFAFNPRNSEEKMKMLILKDKEMKTRLVEQERMYNQRLSDVEKALENALLQLKQITEKNGEVEKRLAELENGQEKSVKKEKLLEEQMNDQNSIIKSNESKIKDIQIFNDQMKTSSQQMEREQTSTKSEIEQLNKKVSHLQDISLVKECSNGIFETLFAENNENPCKKGLVKITGNSNNNDEQELLPNLIDSKWNGDYWASKDVENSYVKIDFKEFLVKINKYRIRVGRTNGTSFFKSWVLKGVKVDNSEVVLDEVNNSCEITQNHPEIIRLVQNQPFIRSIQITMKGESSEDDYYMHMRNIEIFG